jgi:hypothetical protein
MFDSSGCIPSPGFLPAEPAAWIAALGRHDGHDLSDAERIDQIRALEALKGAAAAAQARITEAFDRSQRHDAPALEPTHEVSRSIASQVALARRKSPARAQQHLGVALGLVRNLPHTLRALTHGEISEWRATLIVRETAMLTREDRLSVDAELAPQLVGAGDRRIADLARSIAYRLDPGAAMRRNQKAENYRRVTIRPAPDTMSDVSGLLPVAQGVAVDAALKAHAKTLRADGDQRTLGQIMADTYYARLTGQQDAVAVVEIQPVMNEGTLFRGEHHPAQVPGYGPIPAFLARRIVSEATRAWVLRLYTAPTTQELIAMDSRRRTFRGSCADCWCSATRPAAPRGATPPSPTPTTSAQLARADRPALPTAKESARPATTPRRPRAGEQT